MSESFEDLYGALNDALAEAGSSLVLDPASPAEAIQAATLELYRRFQAMERRSDEEVQLQGKKGLRMVGRARKCLLDPAARAEYDARWRALGKSANREERESIHHGDHPRCARVPETRSSTRRKAERIPKRLPLRVLGYPRAAWVISVVNALPRRPSRSLAALAIILALAVCFALWRSHRTDGLRGVAARVWAIVPPAGTPGREDQVRHRTAVRLAREANRLLDAVEEDIVKFKRYPPSPRQLARVRASMRRKTLDAAEKAERAIGADPGYRPAYVCRVQALRWLLRYRQAHAAAVKALTLFPADEELRSEYAILRHKVGRGQP